MSLSSAPKTQKDVTDSRLVQPPYSELKLEQSEERPCFLDYPFVIATVPPSLPHTESNVEKSEELSCFIFQFIRLS